MSAEEFEEWRVMFRIEQLHPADGAVRHAELLATAYNGPVKRKDKRLWVAGDFATINPWSRKNAPAARKTPLTAKQIAAQVAVINSSRRKH